MGKITIEQDRLAAEFVSRFKGRVFLALLAAAAIGFALGAFLF
jgi:hypothetical protein